MSAKNRLMYTGFRRSNGSNCAFLSAQRYASAVFGHRFSSVRQSVRHKSELDENG